MNQILLCDQDTMTTPCQSHTGWPLHGEDECALLAGVRPFDSVWTCTNCGMLVDYIGRQVGCCGAQVQSVRRGEDYIDIIRINGQYDSAALWAQYFAARRLANKETVNA